MPRVNRIRLANIRYPGNSKIIADLPIASLGENLLFVLTNGGGKSLILQLILQCVLPNCILAKRRISDLLADSRYTGHVAVEWLLDGDEVSYLLTGFCFTNSDNDTRIQHFNYTNYYTESDPLDIAQIPFLSEDKVPLSFKELRRRLKNGGPRVQMFDTKAHYQDELRNYNIHREEWENIRATNGAEGGVTGLFERSKSSVQLIENILLPAVERASYESDAEAGILVETFKRHQRDLMQIPVLQKNLTDYGRISSLAIPLIQSVDRCSELHVRFSDNEMRARGLYHLLNGVKERSVTKLGEVGEQESKLTEDISLCDWKIESYTYFEKTILCLEKLEEIEALKMEVERQERIGQVASEALDKLEAFHRYEKVRSAQRKVEELAAMLRNLERESPELFAELEPRQRQLLYVWRIHEEALVQKSDAIRNQLLESKAQDELLQKQHRELVERRRTLDRQSAIITAWLNDYEERRAAFARLYSSEEADDPPRSLKIVEGRQEHLASLQRSKEGGVLECRQRLERNRKAYMESVRRLSELKQQERVLAKALEQFEQRHEELLGRLSGLKMFFSDLHLQEDSVRQSIRQERERRRALSIETAASLSNLRSRLSYLREQECFVPHPLLLEVRRHLEGVGIRVGLGGEWLQAQEMVEEEKGALVRSHPLLPFSLVCEREDMSRVARHLYGQKEWDRDFPLILIAKHQLVKRDEVAEGSFVVFRSEELEISWSLSALGEWLEAMEERRGKLESEANLRQYEYEQVILCEEELSSFLEEHPREWYQNQRSEHHRWQREIGQEEEVLQELEGERGDTELLIAQLEDERQSIVEELNLLRKKRSDIDELQRRWQLLAVKQEEALSLTVEIEEITARLKDGEDERDAVQQRVSFLRDESRECERAILSHKEVHTRHLAGKELEPQETDADLQFLLGEVQSIETILAKKQADIATVRQHLLSEEEHQRGYQEDLEGTLRRSATLTIDWLRENARVVSRGELDEQKERVAETVARLHEVRARTERAEREYGRLEGAREENKRQIEASFGRGVFEGFNEDDGPRQVERFIEERSAYQEYLALVRDDLKLLQQRISECDQGMTWILSTVEISPHYYSDWRDDERIEVEASPVKVVEHLIKKLQLCLKQLTSEKEQVKKEFDLFIKTLKECNNDRLSDFLRETQEILGGERIFDYGYVSTTFGRIAESVALLEFQTQERLRHLDEDRREIADRLTRRAKFIYRNLQELPRGSRIRLYDNALQLVRVELSRWEDEGEIERMSLYIGNLIEDLKRIEDTGGSEDERERFVEQSLSSRELLNQMSPLSKAKILVFKPQLEAAFRAGRPEFSRWEDVERWSGGEKYAAYMFVFLAITGYLRDRLSGSTRAWRVILADNPFGAASSHHILDPVFEMARVNRVQLICFTDHREEHILRRFPAVFSLKLVPQYGKEYLLHQRIEEIEMGFYRDDGDVAANEG